MVHLQWKPRKTLQELRTEMEHFSGRTSVTAELVMDFSLANTACQGNKAKIKGWSNLWYPEGPTALQAGLRVTAKLARGCEPEKVRPCWRDG